MTVVGKRGLSPTEFRDDGTAVVNTRFSWSEKEFLNRRATELTLTITHLIREIVRGEMARIEASRNGRAQEAARAARAAERKTRSQERAARSAARAELRAYQELETSNTERTPTEVFK